MILGSIKLLWISNSLASKNIEQISNNILNDKNYNFNVSSLKQLSNRLRKIFG